MNPEFKTVISRNSVILLGIAIVLISLQLLLISPLNELISTTSYERIGIILFVSSAIGLIVSIINLVFTIKHDEQKFVPVIAIILFLTSLAFPAIIFFIGLAVGGVG